MNYLGCIFDWIVSCQKQRTKSPKFYGHGQRDSPNVVQSYNTTLFAIFQIIPAICKIYKSNDAEAITEIAIFHAFLFCTPFLTNTVNIIGNCFCHVPNILMAHPIHIWSFAYNNMRLTNTSLANYRTTVFT